MSREGVQLKNSMGHQSVTFCVVGEVEVQTGTVAESKAPLLRCHKRGVADQSKITAISDDVATSLRYAIVMIVSFSVGVKTCPWADPLTDHRSFSVIISDPNWVRY